MLLGEWIQLLESCFENFVFDKINHGKYTRIFCSKMKLKYATNSSPTWMSMSFSNIKTMTNNHYHNKHIKLTDKTHTKKFP